MEANLRKIFQKFMVRLLTVLMLLSLLHIPNAAAFGLASISISDSSVVEGDNGSVNMVFTVTRTGDITSAVVVGYTTADGSALAGTDYTAQTGTLTISSGASSATISVPVIGNTIVQENRSFSVRLTSVVDQYGPSITLAPQQAFGTEQNPWDVAVGDFNNDGRPDLASANYSSNTISVLLNTTAPGETMPSFAAFQQPYYTGDGIGPLSVVASDFNGDGKLDLASANLVSDDITVMLNMTVPGAVTPIFTAQQSYAVGTDPVSLAAGDFNGDGKPDLASANNGSNTISVLLNTTAPGETSPSFTNQQAYTVDVGPYSLAAGDFNGDGRPDLASANYSSKTVSVLLNNTIPGAAMPSFVPQQSIYTGVESVFGTVGDFNGDGRLDMAYANYGADTISVLLNETVLGAPTLSFTPQALFRVGAGPCSLAADDFNGDGRPDLVSANNHSNTVSVLLNTTVPGATTPSFAAQQGFDTGLNPNSVAVGDFNGDGKPDFAIADFGSDDVSVLLNTTVIATGPLAFTTQQEFDTGNQPNSVAAGDFNGDRRPDLASANNHSNTVSVLLNTTAPGATTPSFAAQQVFNTGLYPNSVAVGDFNGDGRLDLASANSGSDDVSVLLNTTAPGAATPSFATQQIFRTGAHPDSVAVGDFNGDGKLDLASANSGPDDIWVLLNTTASGDTTLTFTTQPGFDTGHNPNSVAVGDFNSDGKPDLASANYGSNTVSVLLNTTPPGASMASFAAQQIFSTDRYPSSVAVGDFNGDGMPDLASANFLDDTVSVLLNNTAPGANTPTFAPQQTFNTFFRPYCVAVGDFNGDGKPDIANTNSHYTNHYTVSVFLNETAPGATTPSFSEQQPFVLGDQPKSVAVGDFNGDGRLDLVSASTGTNNVSVLLNLGSELTTSTATGAILDDDAPVSISKVAGDHQSASIYTAFITPLAVAVENGAGHPVQGARVTFTAPSTGASGAFASSATVTTNAAGRASAPALTANGAAGDYQVIASVTGGALPAQFSLTNNKGDTTTTITDMPDPSVYGQSYAVNFTVAPLAAGAQTPAGNITVSDGLNHCTAAVAAGTCNLPSTDVGSRTLTVNYSGDDNYNGSTGSTSHVVDKATSQAALHLSADSVAPGQPVTLTVTVNPMGTAAGPITGTVTFLDGSTALRTLQLVDTGSGFAAQLTVSDLAVGTHSLSASYSGSGNFEASLSNVVHLTVLDFLIYLPVARK
jgi:trimeric autotransporter adhesin